MCDTCHDTGVLCSAPDAETVYCEECVRGLTKAIRVMDAHLAADQGWLARRQAEGYDCEWELAQFGLEMDERKRLRGLLRGLEREDESSELHTDYL